MHYSQGGCPWLSSHKAANYLATPKTIITEQRAGSSRTLPCLLECPYIVPEEFNPKGALPAINPDFTPFQLPF